MTTATTAGVPATADTQPRSMAAGRALSAFRGRTLRAPSIAHAWRSGLVALVLPFAGLVAPATAAATTTGPPPPIAWATSFDQNVFRKAAEQHRFVLLDLHAVWCHWCHVMDDETYRDPAVRALIAGHYVAVSVDADSDPGLTSRYGDWGWPATIVLAPDGTELVKRRGFIPAAQMASMLNAIIVDPRPGPSVGHAEGPRGAGGTILSTAQRQALLRSYDALYDDEHGGWGSIHKYIDASAIELAFAQLDRGDETAERRVRQTLDANLNLIDPVWGGVYQYSDAVDWHSPHYEKLMSYQADDLRLYAEAYARWQEPRYLEAATALVHYIHEFLTAADGAFYVSQDADLSMQVPGSAYYRLDDGGRRQLGIPRVDTHIYARENGWAIRALCRYYDVTGDAAALTFAERAADWIVLHRSLAGGFRHDDADSDGPFLDDSIAMADAFVALYRSTGQRKWLSHAQNALEFVARNFRHPKAGFIAAHAPAGALGVFREPIRALDQNAAVARLANLVFRYTGDPGHRRSAEHAMKLLATVSTDAGGLHADVLLADRELAAAPTHITIVGAKADPAAIALHAAALAYPAPYLQVEWWDRTEGPLPNPAVRYPVLAAAAAFACSENACSTPVYEANRLVEAVRKSRTVD